MSPKLIHGIVPALVTPFDAKGNLLLSSVPALIKRTILKGNCSGVYVCGRTGGAETLTVKERMLMAEAVIKEIRNKVPVIVQVGGTKNVNEAIVLAKHAEKIKADAISSMPSKAKGFSQKQIMAYFAKIGVSTKLPFYIYWTSEYENKMTPEEFLKETKKIKHFAGIKFTNSNLYFFERLITLSEGKINAVSGPDELCLPAMVMGSDGAIGSTYNIMPKLFTKMRNDFEKGNIKSAQKAQVKANRLISKIIEYGDFESIKAILNSQGIPVGKMRNTKKVIDKKKLATLLAIIKKYNIS